MSLADLLKTRFRIVLQSLFPKLWPQVFKAKRFSPSKLVVIDCQRFEIRLQLQVLGSKGICLMNYFCKTISSPVGKLKLIASENGISAILWENDRPGRVRLDGHSIESENFHWLLKLEDQLQEYFSGNRAEFDLPLDVNGTEFQKKVWRALLDIPFAQTSTYQQLAARLGNAKASRAVGMANGKNPVSILVPCHRVIGANGNLTGFAGGLDNKLYLLDLERAAQSSAWFRLDSIKK
jgi:methylated-DNA-[protein]-cysteine S-methyltransferase